MHFIFILAEINRSPPIKQYKAVIIKSPTIKVSLASNLDPSGGQKEARMLSAMKVDCAGYTFTVLESTSQFYSPFMSSRTSYILAYDVTENLETICAELCNTILHIITLVSISVFRSNVCNVNQNITGLICAFDMSEAKSTVTI